jgi:biopolymer transport protein ExbD
MSILQDIASEEAELEMTPMIDVTFLLLIFFMCTIKFKTLEGKLAAYLPKDVGVNASDAEPKEKIDIYINMIKPGHRVLADYEKTKQEVKWNGPTDGEFYLVGHEVKYRVIRDTYDGDKDGIKKIRRKLTDLHRADPERAVTLKPMQGVVYADIIPILDTVIEVGFSDVTFAGSYGK